MLINTGVEIEFLVTENDSQYLRADIKNKTRWALTGDGSISSIHEGEDVDPEETGHEALELVSPILSSDYKESLKEVTSILKNYDTHVNRTCGLHIHLSPLFIKWTPRLLLVTACLYASLHDTLFSIVPKSRRENSFSRPYRSHFINCFGGTLSKEILKPSITSMAEMKSLWYNGSCLDESIGGRAREKYDGTRYYGVNIHSVFYRGSLEVRLHQGTLNETKINNWIELHHAILSKANEISDMRNSKNREYLIEIATRKDPFSLSEALNFFDNNQKIKDYICDRAWHYRFN